MEITTDLIQQQSIKSFQSSIRKMEKALIQMTQKGANTTLIEKRLHAMKIGISVLDSIWYQKPQENKKEELQRAHQVLNDLLPSIEDMYDRSKPGSPQKTLLERRIISMKLAIQAIEDITQSYDQLT